MCGIAGIIHFDSQPIDHRQLQRMTDAVAHRGPDGEGIWIRDGAGLGHRRLSIRDLSDAGKQPMLDDTGTICVNYNGEIYNYAELREAIERQSGYQFRSHCDTELLPIGWRLWGEKLFQRLEGMYAIGIWDTRTRVLTLARDGIGIKPLFFAADHRRVLFSSELKGLLAAGDLPDRIDPAALHTYLACGYTDPNTTLLLGIEQVPPGTICSFSVNGRHASRFWAPRREPSIHRLDDATDAVLAILRKVSAEMLISDVPIGLLLSSGIDSATLAMLLDGDVPSFTAAFEECSHDESDAARRIAKAAGNRWFTVPVDQGTGVAQDFFAVAHAVDGQLADSSCLAHFALCRAVRREVVVALAGDGADEFFGGYPTYKASRVAGWLGPFVPASLANTLGQMLAASMGQSETRLPKTEVAVRFLLGLAAPAGTEHVEWRRLTPRHLLPSLYGSAMRPLANHDPLATYRAAVDQSGGNILDRCLIADQRIYLPGDMLAKVDRMSMAHGLEIRVPFLDRRIMEIAGQIDGRLLAPLRGPTKRVLRHALCKLKAPADVVEGRKKGFNVPIARLLRSELRGIGDILFERNPDLFEPFLVPDTLRALWREHLARSRNHAYCLWAIMIFGAWLLQLRGLPSVAPAGLQLQAHA